MSEEQILEQEAPVAAAAPKNSLANNKLLPFIPLAVTVIAIVLYYVASIMFPVINLFSGLPFKYLLTTLPGTLDRPILSVIVALVLPALVVLAKMLKKPIVAKILIFVALAFLLIQLFAAVVMLILCFFGYGDFIGFLRNFFDGFRGAEVLSSLYYALRNLFGGGIRAFVGILNTLAQLVRSFAEVLFLLKNVLCAVVCLLLAKKN